MTGDHAEEKEALLNGGIEMSPFDNTQQNVGVPISIHVAYIKPKHRISDSKLIRLACLRVHDGQAIADLRTKRRQFYETIKVRIFDSEASRRAVHELFTFPGSDNSICGRT